MPEKQLRLYRVPSRSRLALNSINFLISYNNGTKIRKFPPPLEDLKQLSEEEVRAWFGKVNTYRDEAIMQIRTKCDNDVFNVRTEQQVERNRIICLIDLKRSQLPSGGTPDEREKALALRQEMHNLDHQMQLNDINTQKKIYDLKHEKKVAINALQRQWETATGVLKQALIFVCEKAKETT